MTHCIRVSLRQGVGLLTKYDLYVRMHAAVPAASHSIVSTNTALTDFPSTRSVSSWELWSLFGKISLGENKQFRLVWPIRSGSESRPEKGALEKESLLFSEFPLPGELG